MQYLIVMLLFVIAAELAFIGLYVYMFAHTYLPGLAP